MEWYSRSDANQLIVPKDHDELDWFPSSNDWTELEFAAFESFVSPKKHSTLETYSAGESFSLNMKSFYNEVDINSSGNERHGSFQLNVNSHQQPDYQDGGPFEIDQTDDIFLSSFPRDSPTGADYFQGSLSYSPNWQDSIVPNDGYLSDMKFDLQDILGNMCDQGSSIYSDADEFNQTMCCEDGELAAHCPVVEVPVEIFSISAEQGDSDGKDNEEVSLEEAVLQDLQKVTSQLTEKTRNCFRDAFYRFANNSKKPVIKQSQNEYLLLDSYTQLAVHNERYRLRETEPTETKTNAVDKDIANLMFNKILDNFQLQYQKTQTGICRI